MASSSDETIDIVIPTFNSGTTFEQCLSSVRKSMPLSRIIIIDNYSKDSTVDIALKYGCELYEFGGTLGEARMKGISLVKSDWFLFLDSDVIIDDTTISKLASFRRPDVGAVSAYPIDPVWCTEFEMNKMSECIELGAKDRGLTCCTLIRTDLVRDVDLKGLSAYEDKAIKNHILFKGYKWLFVKVPVIHLADHGKGQETYYLKALWTGASMRRARI